MLNDWTLTPLEDLFSFKKMELMPYEKFDDIWISVTIEMDLSLLTYERTVFTFFEMLSDIGGLSGILMTTFGALTAIWNYNAFDNMMVSYLFNVKKTQAELDRDSEQAVNCQRCDSPIDTRERYKPI